VPVHGLASAEPTKELVRLALRLVVSKIEQIQQIGRFNRHESSL
jgi:hypothetical protein